MAVAATSDERRAHDQSRARYPDSEGFVERDGVRIFYERYGEGERTILLLPTWSIIHSRFWKGQIPYLARHFRVVTFDGRGNGRSDRPPQPEAYAEKEFAEQAFVARLETYEGWDKWNSNYWLEDYEGFLEFFLGQIFTEPHSTKQLEDGIGWALETDAETLVATQLAPRLPDEGSVRELVA